MTHTQIYVDLPSTPRGTQAPHTGKAQHTQRLPAQRYSHNGDDHSYHVLHLLCSRYCSKTFPENALILTIVEVDIIFIPHFTDEETEGQRSKIKCLRSQSSLVQTYPPIPVPSLLNPVYFHRHTALSPPRHAPHTLRASAVWGTSGQRRKKWPVGTAAGKLY